jgi:hypothetical protein
LAREAAAFFSVLTDPAAAARQAGHTRTTLWIGHFGTGTTKAYPNKMGM